MKPLETAAAKKAKDHIERHMKYLSDPTNVVKMLLTLEWKKTFPSAPGVYSVFDKSILIYVGESGNLQKRMNDLRATYNHTLRSSLGAAEFNHLPGFKKATSKEKFPDNIEKLLEVYIKRNLTVIAIQVDIGRKEIEEHIFSCKKPKYNKKGKRS